MERLDGKKTFAALVLASGVVLGACSEEAPVEREQPVEDVEQPAEPERPEVTITKEEVAETLLPTIFELRDALREAGSNDMIERAGRGEPALPVSVEAIEPLLDVRVSESLKQRIIEERLPNWSPQTDRSLLESTFIPWSEEDAEQPGEWELVEASPERITAHIETIDDPIFGRVTYEVSFVMEDGRWVLDRDEIVQ